MKTITKDTGFLNLHSLVILEQVYFNFAFYSFFFLWSRFYVLHHLRKLKFLDSASVTAEEFKEAILKGRFMHIKKPKVSQFTLDVWDVY